MAKTTILIIDDSADMRLLLSTKLKKHEYHTAFASDAMQAVTIARQTRPDAIILDLSLPGGNGFLVLERLKSHNELNNIPVIILTADRSAESEFKGLQKGAAFFLHKPVQDEALLNAVKCAVGAGAECPTADAERKA